MSKKILSFQLPKVNRNKDNNIAVTGFPYMDRTTKKHTSYETYNVIAVNCDVIVSTVISKKSNKNNNRKEEPTRPRNKFMIARSFINCLLRYKETAINSQTVSKIVSDIWRNSGQNFVSYFDYLAIFDNNLHQQIFDNDFLRFKTKRTINKKHLNMKGTFVYEVPEKSYLAEQIEPQTILMKSRKEYLDLCASSLLGKENTILESTLKINAHCDTKSVALPFDILKNSKKTQYGKPRKSKKLDLKQPMFSKFSILSSKVGKQKI